MPAQALHYRLRRQTAQRGGENIFGEQNENRRDAKEASVGAANNAAKSSKSPGTIVEKTAFATVARCAARTVRKQEEAIMNTFDHESFEFTPETEAFENEQFEWGGETEVFSESEVMELASELLEISNETELDRFLGDLIKKAGSALGQVVRSPVGQAVGSMLKGAAKQALPLAGAALGGVVGGPLGAQIGSGLASAAGGAFGLETEMMNAEDREFEGAKKFVKMAGDTVKTTLSGNPGIDNALATAQVALKEAAQKHAPALLSPPRGARTPGMSPTTGSAPGHGMGRVGRWVRHGRNIIIVNCQPTRA